MRTFKTRWFGRFARSEGISDVSLREAIDRAARGLVDADLGGGQFKQRVARSGSGRSAGFRVIVACRFGDRAVFLYAFAKSRTANITSDELVDLRVLARAWLNASPVQIEAALGDGALTEVSSDGTDTE